MRTGRANPSLVEKLPVNYYGSEVPMQQLASFSVPEARQLLITPFDKGSMEALEKAIQNADLGLNPSNDGKTIRIPVPALTEERRKQLVKKVKGMGEDSKTAVRQIRRDSNEETKNAQKAGEISEDDARRWLDEIQKKTDASTEEIDKLCANKEADLSEV